MALRRFRGLRAAVRTCQHLWREYAVRQSFSLGEAESSLGDAESSLGDAKSSLGDDKSSLGDAKSSLGDDKSSLGDAESSLGDVQVSCGELQGTFRLRMREGSGSGSARGTARGQHARGRRWTRSRGRAAPWWACATTAVSSAPLRPSPAPLAPCVPTSLDQPLRQV